MSKAMRYSRTVNSYMWEGYQKQGIKLEWPNKSKLISSVTFPLIVV